MWNFSFWWIKMISYAKSQNRAYLPILPETDYAEYNVEGYIQLDSNNLELTEKGQLQTDHVENEEILETNKEYSYYAKHFMGHEHFNFIGRYENNLCFLISIKHSDSKCKCIFRYRSFCRFG